jgi:PPOX class probable F420-dependent enzyme
MSTCLSTPVRDLLDAPVFATVATINPNGQPQMSVVWVGRDDHNPVFVVSAGSLKERNLRRDPRVSVLLNPPDAPYTYAVLHGTATLTTDGAHDLLDELSRAYTGKDYAAYSSKGMPQNLITVQVDVGRVSGNF